MNLGMSESLLRKPEDEPIGSFIEHGVLVELSRDQSSQSRSLCLLNGLSLV